MIKLKNEYIPLSEKDLVLVGGKAGIGKTRFIVNEVNNSQRDNKVLFLSLEKKETELSYDYSLQKSNNLMIINNENELEENLKNNSYDYLYVDHLSLLKDTSLETLTNYMNEYNLKIFMTDFIKINEKDEKYLNDEYNLLTKIYILKEEELKEIK
jgi:predicted ATP-dependent serine protease